MPRLYSFGVPNALHKERSPLAVEIKKRLPFDSPLEELVLNIFRTHSILASRVESALKPFGLSGPKYNVLRILRGVSQNPDPAHRRLPSLEIADRMITRVPDVTRLVDALVRDGLAERARCTQDRRVIYVGITPKGKRKIDALDAALPELHKELFAELSGEEVRRLNQLLDKVREGVTR